MMFVYRHDFRFRNPKGLTKQQPEYMNLVVI